jgi:hypothetical protein
MSNRKSKKIVYVLALFISKAIFKILIIYMLANIMATNGSVDIVTYHSVLLIGVSFSIFSSLPYGLKEEDKD